MIILFERKAMQSIQTSPKKIALSVMAAMVLLGTVSSACADAIKASSARVAATVIDDPDGPDAADFIDEPDVLVTNDQKKIVVSTEWGVGNIGRFIERARELGFQISLLPQ